MFSWLIPKEKQILDMIETEAANLLKSTEALNAMIQDFTRLQEKRDLIRELEHNGDAIVHTIYLDLNKSFITPIDREDISALASAIDSVLDSIDGAADRFLLFKIQKPTQYMIEVCNYIHKAVTEIQFVVSKIRNLKNVEDLLKHCRQIDVYEHDADIIYRAAIAELFEGRDAVHIMKLKEIYETLEDAVDKCIDVVDVVEDIVIKNA